MTRLADAALLRRLLAAQESAEAPERHAKPRKRAKRSGAAAPRRESAGEAAFAAALRIHQRTGYALPEPVRELVFAPPRRWRFDFAWPDALVAVEIDGGQWKAGGGRHNTDADRDKLNHAAAIGWRVVRFSPQQVERDPDGCVALLRRALDL
jgi:very-short-patch-repair endonuclease